MSFFKDLLQKIKGGKSSEEVSKKASSAEAFKIDIASPCNGKLIDQKNIPDEGFSEGHMGRGFGIEPKDGNFVAFMAGQLVVLYRTKHAYFIKDNGSGISVMCHIGINTVEINEDRRAFITDRELNQNLKIGDPLCTANLDIIKEENKSTITALLIQHEGMEKMKIIYKKEPGELVSAGEIIMTIVKDSSASGT